MRASRFVSRLGSCCRIVSLFGSEWIDIRIGWRRRPWTFAQLAGTLLLSGGCTYNSISDDKLYVVRPGAPVAIVKADKVHIGYVDGLKAGKSPLAIEAGKRRLSVSTDGSGILRWKTFMHTFEAGMTYALSPDTTDGFAVVVTQVSDRPQTIIR